MYMPVEWKKTKYQGVRYYEHKTRKHGANFDRYFTIRYKVKGIQREEGLGWASEKWTAERAALELAELKKAHTLGEGPASLAEKRALDRERREKERQEKARLGKKGMTFGQFFTETYYPIQKTNKKRGSYEAEKYLFELWINPVIGNLPFNKISHFHLEKLKKKMLGAGKAPRTAKYALDVMNQVWKVARQNGIINEDSPTKNIKPLIFDNRRIRFLTHEEAEKLFANLSARSQQLHDIALLSLHTGMRAGEIFSLTWGQVDIDQGLITIVDPKATKTRTAFMTMQAQTMLKKLYGNGKNNNDLIFKDRNDKRIKEVSQSFDRAVKDLKLNEGITDWRQKLVFHSLRHSYASWLVESGTDLYTVSKLIGHSTLKMTERYSHLGQDTLQNAVKNLEKTMTRARKEKQSKSESKTLQR
jgi:integrase